MTVVWLALAFAQDVVPAAPSTGVPGGDELVDVIGEKKNAPATRALFKEHSLKAVKGTEWSGSAGEGICVQINDQGTLHTLRLQAHAGMDCPDGRYAGELPQGLRWGTTLADVEARLGAGHDAGERRIWSLGQGRFLMADFGGGASLEAVTLTDWPMGVSPSEVPAIGSRKALPTAPPPPPVPALAPQPAAPVRAPAPVVDRASAFAVPHRTGARADGVAAVVVGLEAYPFLGSPVPFAHRDAAAFNDLLIYTLGVPQAKVQLLSSGSREQILEAIDRASTEAGPGGTVWVYFAGHGAANPLSGDRMLLGDDVRADAAAFASRGVGVREVEERLAKAGRQGRMVLDACFGGASRSGGSIAGGTRLAVPVYALAPSAGGSTQWNAAGPDQISGPLDDARHGAFTYYAVGALRGWADGELDGVRDGQVTADEAQAYVTRSLRAEGKNAQTPVWVGEGGVVLSRGTESPPR